MSACEEKESAFNEAVTNFGNALKKRTDAASKEVKDELDGKQKEWDEKGDITFKFEVTFETTAVLIPVVEIVMRDHRWVYDVPQVTMKQRDIIFGVPEVKMVLKKTGQYPETFCEDTWISLPFGGKTKGIPKCTVRWKDIITKVPEVRMANKKISLHIPEFKVDQTETVIGIPEFSVSQKEIKLDLPQFKLKDIVLNPGGAKDDVESIKKDADAFAAESKARIERAVAEAKEEEKFPVIHTASEYFGCLREDMMARRESIQAMFQGLIDQSSAVLKSLTDAGAQGTPEAQQVRESLDQTAAQMADALDKIDAAIAELNKSEKSRSRKSWEPSNWNPALGDEQASSPNDQPVDFLQQHLRLPLHHQPRILLWLRSGDRCDPLHEVEDALGRAAFLDQHRLDDPPRLRPALDRGEEVVEQRIPLTSKARNNLLDMAINLSSFELEMLLNHARGCIARECAKLDRAEAAAEFKKRWTELLDRYDMQYGVTTVNETLAELGFYRYEEPMAI